MAQEFSKLAQSRRGGGSGSILSNNHSKRGGASSLALERGLWRVLSGQPSSDRQRRLRFGFDKRISSIGKHKVCNFVSLSFVNFRPDARPQTPLSLG